MSTYDDHLKESQLAWIMREFASKKRKDALKGL
jgi:hypothetical protein